MALLGVMQFPNNEKSPFCANELNEIVNKTTKPINFFMIIQFN